MWARKSSTNNRWLKITWRSCDTIVMLRYLRIVRMINESFTKKIDPQTLVRWCLTCLTFLLVLRIPTGVGELLQVVTSLIRIPAGYLAIRKQSQDISMYVNGYFAVCSQQLWNRETKSSLLKWVFRNDVLCFKHLVNIGSDNALSSVRQKAITRTNGSLLSIGLWGTCL